MLEGAAMVSITGMVALFFFKATLLVDLPVDAANFSGVLPDITKELIRGNKVSTRDLLRREEDLVDWNNLHREYPLDLG